MMETVLAKKDFSVFDCDGHVNDPNEVWTQYIEPEWRDRASRAYWKDDRHAIINGRTEVVGGGLVDFRASNYSGITVAGPGINKKVLKRLQSMSLTPEQRDYLDHKGAVDPVVRTKEMDLMGIDQAMIIPTQIVNHLLYCDDTEAAAAIYRAYNNWAGDYCSAAPNRLFAAGMVPFQDPIFAMQEIERLAKRDFRVGLIRPVDVKGRYPNALYADRSKGSISSITMDDMYRCWEQTGMVLGMHTFPAHPVEDSPFMTQPGELLLRLSKDTDRQVDSGALSFIFEGMTWLIQVLMSGFLDRYPRMKMAIFESNGTWLVPMLEEADRHFQLYRNERRQPANRLPSEAFYEQCFIAFEGDETTVFRQWDRYEDVGVWSSDTYHHDGSDAWSAIHEMDEVETPKPVQAKLLGGNARRMYSIPAMLSISEEREIERPDWFPTPGEVEEHWRKVSYPRKGGTAAAPTQGGMGY